MPQLAQSINEKGIAHQAAQYQLARTSGREAGVNKQTI
jgi:hypothetical protein